MSSCYEISALDLCWILVFYILLYKSSLKIKDFYIFAKGKFFGQFVFLSSLCVYYLCHVDILSFIKLSYLFFMSSNFHIT